MKLLLDNGGSQYVNYQNIEYKGTVLHKAAMSANVETVRLLLDSGAKPNIKDDYGETPLHKVLRTVSMKMFKEVIKNSCNNSPLFKALNTTLANPIEKIINDNHDETPLLKALQNNTTNLFKGTTKNNHNEIHPLKAFDTALTNSIKIMMGNNYDETSLFKALDTIPFDLDEEITENDYDETSSSEASDFFNRQRKDTIETINLLVKYKADINATDLDGNTPMLTYLLGYDAKQDVLEALFYKGADINIANKEGKNALMYCFFYKNNEFYIPHILIGRATKETINAADIHGKTPLIHAIIASVNNKHAEQAGVVDFIKELIGAGADINAKDSKGKTALSYLAEGYKKGYIKIDQDNNADEAYNEKISNNKNIERNETVLFRIANELIHAGLDIKNIHDHGTLGINFINSMAKCGGIEATTFLNEKNNGHVDILVNVLSKNDNDNNLGTTNNLVDNSEFNINIQDNKGRTLLMRAIEKKSSQDIDFILQAGADVNIRDNTGRTALMIALESGNIDAFNKLIDNNANVDIRDNNGKTALMIAIENNFSGAIINRLIKNSLNINIKDNEGNTALMYACKKNCFSVAYALVKAGANVNIRDNHGNTVLMTALRHYHLDLVKALLPLIDDINAQNNEGVTALMIAAQISFSSNPIIALIGAGANVNIVDNNGYNALSYAATTNNTDAITYLVDNGAKINFKDIAMQTMLLNAVFNPTFETIQFFKDNDLTSDGILEKIDYDNKKIKQVIYENLVEKGCLIKASLVSNTNKNYVIGIIKIVVNISNEKIIIHLNPGKEDMYMHCFINFALKTDVNFILTKKERNKLDYIAVSFDFAVSCKIQEKINSSIDDLLMLCNKYPNIYNVISKAIDKNFISDKNKSLTIKLNLEGFNTKLFAIRMQANKIFTRTGISEDEMENHDKKSVINKYFELASRYKCNDNIYALSQNLDVNKACLAYQDIPSDFSKQLLISDIINNINNIKNKEEIKKTKQILLGFLETTMFHVYGKNVSIGMAIDIETNSDIGTCLINRLEKELKLDRLINANNALNNNQKQK